MKFSLSEKKLFVFCAAVIALPLGVAAFFGHINAPPEINIPAYPRAPKPNGYDLYVQAATLISASKPPVGPANDTQILTDPKVRAQRYGLKRKTAWLSTNQAGYAIFESALQTPGLAPPSRSFSDINKDNGRLRELARNTLARSDTFWMRGDNGGALQSDLDIVQMGHDIRRGGGIIQTLVGVAIGAIGRSGSHNLVDKLDAATSKAGARRLEKLLGSRWTLPHALTEEKYATQNSWLEVFKNGDWRTPDSVTIEDESPSLKQRWQVLTISKQRVINDIGADYDRQIANARLRYAQKGTPPQPLNDPFAEGYRSLGDKMRFNDTRDSAGDQLLMLRLALRAYQLENGVYPPALASLAPKYLKAIPADPFSSGATWRYARKGQTYKLWSIGPDGRDDGGKAIPWPKPRRQFPDARKRLPSARPESRGDIVAGANS